MPGRDRFLSTANVLSLSRAPLGAVFAWRLGPPFEARWWQALGVLALAGLTDVLDGWFARREYARRSGGVLRGTPAGVGSWLDPICDKVFVATVLAAIWFHFRPPLLWLALILAREITQVPLSLVYVAQPSFRKWLHYDFRASVLGKAATVIQFAAIAALMLASRVAYSLAIASFVVGMIAVGDYLRRAVRIRRRRALAPGPRLETSAHRSL
jgi:phosphatidylglycerophosphate synthase